MNTNLAIDIVTNALAVLNKMGTADNIADFFEASGIRGRPEYEDDCPVVNWINPILEPTGERVEVFQYFVRICDCDKEIILPESVAEFIVKFDKGEYPTLIESDPLAIEDDEDDD